MIVFVKNRKTLCEHPKFRFSCIGSVQSSKNANCFNKKKRYLYGLLQLPFPNCAGRHSIFTLREKWSFLAIFFCIKTQHNKGDVIQQKKVSLIEYGDSYDYFEKSLEELRDSVIQLREERGMP